MSIVRDSSWAAGAALALTAARFALVAILARRLTVGGFGGFAYAQWLTDVCFLVCSLGVTGVASRYVAEFSTRPDRLRAFMVSWRRFAFSLPFVAGGTVLVGAWMSGLDLKRGESVGLAVWAAASALWATHTAVLAGLQRFDLIFRANLLAGSIMVVGAFFLPLYGEDVSVLFGLMALASSTAAMVGFSVSAQTVVGSGSGGDINGDDWRRVRAYGLNIWISALLWSLVWSRGEMPIVKEFLGDGGVAQYAAALALFGGGVQGVMLAVSGAAPQLTRLWGSDQRAEALATARKVMDVQMLMCGGGALVLIFLGPELISVVFGSAYQEASVPLAFLALGLLSMALSSQNFILQIATDGRFSRNIMLFGLVVLFGSAILLTPRLGLSGAAISRSGSMLLLAVISVIAVVSRWGKESVSLASALTVFLVCGSSALCMVWKSDLALALRAVLLVLTSVALALCIRDRNGRLVFLVLPGFIWSRLRGPARGFQESIAGRAE